MKWGHLEIFVSDSEQAKAFYRDVLGFVLLQEQPGGFVWMRCGESEVLLRPGRSPRAAAGKVYQDASTAIVLYTGDLVANKAELESRGLTFRGTDGSERCLTFTDPDGNWFQLVDPGDHDEPVDTGSS